MKFDTSSFIFILSLWVCFGTFFFAQSSMAQSTFSPSSSEDVALSFYKTAEIQPNFKAWAKKTDDYKYKSITEASGYIDNESARLFAKWNDLDKQGNTIDINFSTVAIVKQTKKKNIEDATFYNLHILLNGADKAYFPYKFYGMNIAVIPHNIDNVLSFEIDESNANLILKNLKLDLNEPVDIELSIHPSVAYSQKPEIIDGVEQWVLMGDVVTMQMSAKKTNTVLWHYTAKDYVSPKRAVLNNVFDLKRQESKIDENPLE